MNLMFTNSAEKFNMETDKNILSYIMNNHDKHDSIILVAVF